MDNGKFKKSFTLIEMIFVIVILTFIAIGSFNLISKLYKRNYIAKTTSDFEYFSQQLTDQLSILLYNRIPLSVIGYDGHNFKYIGNIDEKDNFPIIEWIGELDEAKTGLNLSGFADLYASNKPKLKALDFNSVFINDILHNKYNTADNLDKLTAIIFAGSFDKGEEEAESDEQNAFGWHGNEHKYVFTISNYSQNGSNCDLSLDNTDNKRIYEKFYLADSAYTLALGKDIDINTKCIQNLHLKKSNINNTLFLFYNFRPWRGETFCADNNGNPEGNVTVMAQNVKGFKFKKVNSHLEMFFTFFKNRGDINISVSKQKVVF
ncbi:type II secretion system protein [Lebetimonas natsushimae]|nr:type II secretion system protein [Lebetimonas natsushimae]